MESPYWRFRKGTGSQTRQKIDKRDRRLRKEMGEVKGQEIEGPDGLSHWLCDCD